jgi:hypothetical protein
MAPATKPQLIMMRACVRRLGVGYHKLDRHSATSGPGQRSKAPAECTNLDW